MKYPSLDVEVKYNIINFEYDPSFENKMTALAKKNGGKELSLGCSDKGYDITFSFNSLVRAGKFVIVAMKDKRTLWVNSKSYLSKWDIGNI